jgi:hypothetical protein
VTFRYRETGSGELHRCRLPVQEFIRRFLQHVLPRGFTKVRSAELATKPRLRRVQPDLPRRPRARSRPAAAVAGVHELGGRTLREPRRPSGGVGRPDLSGLSSRSAADRPRDPAGPGATGGSPRSPLIGPPRSASPAPRPAIAATASPRRLHGPSALSRPLPRLSSQPPARCGARVASSLPPVALPIASLPAAPALSAFPRSGPIDWNSKGPHWLPGLSSTLLFVAASRDKKP